MKLSKLLYLLILYCCCNNPINNDEYYVKGEVIAQTKPCLIKETFNFINDVKLNVRVMIGGKYHSTLNNSLINDTNIIIYSNIDSIIHLRLYNINDITIQNKWLNICEKYALNEEKNNNIIIFRVNDGEEQKYINLFKKCNIIEFSELNLIGVINETK